MFNDALAILHADQSMDALGIVAMCTSSAGLS